VSDIYWGSRTVTKWHFNIERDRLQALRETLASRRRNLSAAKLQTPVNVHPTALPTPREAEALSALSATISRARAGLVQELIEVFNVVEVGGRPPIGGKAGIKGEWTIGDLILPVPGDMRRASAFPVHRFGSIGHVFQGYPPDHINAVLTHTVHFLSLLTFYLGIKLPFEVIWSGGKLGIGQPWIGAIRGTETGGWARFVFLCRQSITMTSVRLAGGIQSIHSTFLPYLHPHHPQCLHPLLPDGFPQPSSFLKTIN